MAFAAVLWCKYCSSKQAIAAESAVPKDPYDSATSHIRKLEAANKALNCKLGLPYQTVAEQQ